MPVRVPGVMPRVVFVVVCALVGVTACGGRPSSNAQATTTTTSTSTTSVVALSTGGEPDACTDAVCTDGITIDGAQYIVGCTAIRSEFVTTETIARGRLQQRDVEARVVAGVDRRLFVAVNLPGGACGEGEGFRSDWSVLIAPNVDTRAALEQLCRVGDMTDPQKHASSCS